MKQEGIWHRKSSTNLRPCCEAGRYLVQENALYKGGDGLNVPAGIRPRPVSTLEGSQFCVKDSFSPDPESGEQWTKTQGARKPSAVLSADVCLSMCLSSALRVCVCAGIVSGLVLF